MLHLHPSGVTACVTCMQNENSAKNVHVCLTSQRRIQESEDGWRPLRCPCRTNEICFSEVKILSPAQRQISSSFGYLGMQSDMHLICSFSYSGTVMSEDECSSMFVEAEPITLTFMHPILLSCKSILPQTVSDWPFRSRNACGCPDDRCGLLLKLSGHYDPSVRQTTVSFENTNSDSIHQTSLRFAKCWAHPRSVQTFLCNKYVMQKIPLGTSAKE